MGHWGTEPWANDAASDWCDGLFESTKLAQHIETTLILEIADHCDEIRAAAHILLMLGENHIWPSESRIRCLNLAATKLQLALDCKLFTNAHFIAEVRNEIAALRKKAASHVDN